MSTSLSSQQRAIVDELLEGVHASTSTEELQLHLRTVTNYVDGVAGLPAEGGVVLQSFGTKKILVIKALRRLVSIGLKEAKTLVESAPVILCDAAHARAGAVVEHLREAGAEVNIETAVRGNPRAKLTWIVGTK